MSDTKQSWAAEVRLPGKDVFWVGPFETTNMRHDAKRAARLYVSSILPLDTMILRIARCENAPKIDVAKAVEVGKRPYATGSGDMVTVPVAILRKWVQGSMSMYDAGELRSILDRLEQGAGE